ncbi:MAG: hypothetical protein N7Q72_03340 [Spiroplasma sp. Tabriz.8]|nr:hypothetical protein [Spiroplasma sp. Tabriz.8]
MRNIHSIYFKLNLFFPLELYIYIYIYIIIFHINNIYFILFEIFFIW